jgi:hypothetical protein
VPGGGRDADGRTWATAKADFLVHVKPLAALFRAKVRAALRQRPIYAEIPPDVWREAWVVDCRAVGNARAALKYLAPYIFRVALSNNRIVRVADDQVTFRYRLGATGQTAYCTLDVQEFIRRFLQHILPKRFVKLRYYGLFRPGQRQLLARIRGYLLLQRRTSELQPLAEARTTGMARVPVCAVCGQPLRLEGVLLRHNRGPPSRAAHGLRQHPACTGAAWSGLPCTGMFGCAAHVRR